MNQSLTSVQTKLVVWNYLFLSEGESFHPAYHVHRCDHQDNKYQHSSHQTQRQLQYIFTYNNTKQKI